MLSLRPYQREAVDALWRHLQSRDDNPVLVLPTGAGKGVILAEIAQVVSTFKGRLTIVSHVKELLVQTAENIQKMAPQIPVGIYSSGLGSKEAGYAVTIAGIQSCYEKAEDFGKLDIIAIDEAHRIPDDGEGMYRTFLEHAKRVNPAVRLVGLTATPYRTGSGFIAKPENLLNKIAYEIGVRELIVKGYLSPLKSKAAFYKIDTSKVGVRGGEFIQSELQTAVSDQDLVMLACQEIAGKTQDRKSVLVFCTGIDHARTVSRFLRDIEGEGVTREVFGDTSSDERARNLEAFKAGAFKYLVNVDVLTTGFDAPNVDCVAVLRPTMSPGLWVQMVGRGFRLSPGKTDCLVLDFGGNVYRHGPVDRILVTEKKLEGGEAPVKECPQCQEVVPIGCAICPDCGAELPKSAREIKHDTKAAESSILSEPEEVTSIFYSKHEKMKDRGISRTLKVTYLFGDTEVNEFVCFEHQGFPRDKAIQWWRVRSSQPVPLTVDMALTQIRQFGIREPQKALLESQGKYLTVKRAMELQERTPEWLAQNDRFERGVETW